MHLLSDILEEAAKQQLSTVYIEKSEHHYHMYICHMRSFIAKWHC